jgi:O-antigen/teichoic acid export membrane protein
VIPSFRKKLLGGLLWQFSATVFQALLQLLVLAILARLLTPRDFGAMAAAAVLMNFASIFSELAIGPAIVQRQNLRDIHLRTCFALSLYLALTISLLLAISASSIAAFFQIGGIASILGALSISFLIQSVSTVAQSLLQRELRFSLLASIRAISALVSNCFIAIPLAFFHCGVWALVCAFISQHVFSSIAFLCFRPHPKSLKISLIAFTDIISFATNLTIARMANFVASQADNIIVARLLGANALGVYDRAYNLMAGPSTMVGQILDNVLFPAFSAIQTNTSDLRIAYKRILGITALFSIPIGAIASILAPQIVCLLLGPNWSDAIIPFRILALGIFFRTSSKVCTAFIRATGAVRQLAHNQVLYAVIIIIAASIGQFWGVPGVTIGTLSALGIIWILLLDLVKQRLAFSWCEALQPLRPPILLTAILASVLVFLTSRFAFPNSSTSLALAISPLALLLTTLFLFKIAPNTFFANHPQWILCTLKTFFVQRVSSVPPSAPGQFKATAQQDSHI